MRLHDQDKVVFQQDNASIHNVKSTKTWLTAKNIKLLDLLSKSPDLNPIENLWGILLRRVYNNERQFDNKDSLLKCIKKSWDEITSETLVDLTKSMQKRCVEVIQLNEAKCKN